MILQEVYGHWGRSNPVPLARQRGGHLCRSALQTPASPPPSCCTAWRACAWGWSRRWWARPPCLWSRPPARTSCPGSSVWAGSRGRQAWRSPGVHRDHPSCNPELLSTAAVRDESTAGREGGRGERGEGEREGRRREEGGKRREGKERRRERRGG